MTESGSVTAGAATAVAGATTVADLIKAKVRDVPDYPQPGVVFKDITPLLGDAGALAAIIAALGDGYGPVDKVAGIEARGFILASAVACRLGAGFVPVRKQGRLPMPVHTQSYDLEYGSATIEVHQDAFRPGERVLLVDDVLATGGTAEAAIALIRRAGADLAGFAVLMELTFLGGRAKVPEGLLKALLAV